MDEKGSSSGPKKRRMKLQSNPIHIDFDYKKEDKGAGKSVCKHCGEVLSGKNSKTETFKIKTFGGS